MGAIKQADIPTFEDADKREAVFHNFDEVPEIVGKLKTIQQGEFGDQYVIETISGDVTVGTYDVLKSKIHQQDIGKFVKILCKGYVQSAKTKRKYKDFEVSVK